MKKRYIDPIKLKMAIAINNMSENPKSLEDIIDKEPDADVEPIVYAEWKNNSRGNTYCSECFGETGTMYEYSRCPNCGAHMNEQ